MSLDKINKLLEKVMDDAMDTIFCKAKIKHYGDEKVIELDGYFTPAQIKQIYNISVMFEKEKL